MAFKLLVVAALIAICGVQASPLIGGGSPGLDSLLGDSDDETSTDAGALGGSSVDFLAIVKILTDILNKVLGSLGGGVGGGLAGSLTGGLGGGLTKDLSNGLGGSLAGGLAGGLTGGIGGGLGA